MVGELLGGGGVWVILFLVERGVGGRCDCAWLE
jgi:hypothetical protein